MNKVFGVGLGRTGTKSFASAMKTLGFNFLHMPRESRLWLGRYDGANDIVVADNYKRLDRKFPNSKFILTIRDKESWLKSIARKSLNKPRTRDGKRKPGRFRQGEFLIDLETYSSRYDNHVADVLDYFKDRPNDLLIFDVIGGDSWDKLCPFVCKKVIRHKLFPHI